ncbi:MAG: hypothetical protein BGN82_08855 [Alphaproteobacteria bacterium 65-7]|nr:MAG: hypothetical protein BGN82_08855 [Alphaproteobacteria bacterium 65-7]
MTKKKLLEDIKKNPARIYRAPADVLRDRRFGDAERLEILKSWRGGGDAPGLDALIAEVEQRFAANGHAAE